MKRKIFAVAVAMTLTLSLATTAYAASSPSSKSSSSSSSSATTAASTATTAVGVPAAQLAARDYGAAITPAMQQALATTPLQAVALSAAATVAPVALSNGAAIAVAPADPGLVSLAKADVLFNSAVTAALARAGIGTNGAIPTITAAGTLAATDGRAISRQTISLTVPGIASAQGVRIIVYTPDANGVMQPQVITPRFRNGQLQVTLPVPCEYNVVTNLALPQ